MGDMILMYVVYLEDKIEKLEQDKALVTALYNNLLNLYNKERRKV
jgi:hypothetical protein